MIMKDKNISRRQFLKATTGVATGVVAFPYVIFISPR